jgi:hypothetical protein
VSSAVTASEAAAPADVLTTVRLSPAHVSAHDRRAWLDLFTDDAVVHDPVGAAATYKHDGGLERFWDALIAPNPVRFEVRGDFVQGDDVIRDVTIISELAPGVLGQVPAYLFYRTKIEGGVRRIERLSAHWSIKMIEHRGPGAWKPLLAQFGRMLSRLRFGWLCLYLASPYRGVGAKGPEQLRALASAVKLRDRAALEACFVPGQVELRFGERLGTSAGDLLDFWPAGSELVLEAAIPAGWTTAARFRVEGPAPTHGIVVFEHAVGDRRLHGARFFVAR